MRSIRIPSDRVGALVGKDGSSKKMIEERTGIKLQIDKEGEVVYDDNAEGVEPIMALQIMDVIKAIGRGFNPDKAMKLLDDASRMSSATARTRSSGPGAASSARTARPGSSSRTWPTST